MLHKRLKLVTHLLVLLFGEFLFEAVYVITDLLSGVVSCASDHQPASRYPATKLITHASPAASDTRRDGSRALDLCIIDPNLPPASRITAGALALDQSGERGFKSLTKEYVTNVGTLADNMRTMPPTSFRTFFRPNYETPNPARPFNLLLGRRVTPDSEASAVGELGCFDIGLIGYIDRELCPALTQQELRNILVSTEQTAFGGTLIGLKLQVMGRCANSAQRHVRALADMSSEPPGSAEPIGE